MTAAGTLAAGTLDVVFDALANEPRREIVARLAQGPTTTPQIGRHFGFSKQALSRHMSILEAAGLIERTVRGRVHELRLVPARLDDVSGWVTQVRLGWESNLDRLGRVLGNLDV
jgi:DNA-binding transcriptional ArsR family regulator